MQRVHAWATRHPRVIDACLAALVALLLLPAAVEFGDFTGIGWLWYPLYHAPLVWRRRAPAIVFGGYLGLLGISSLLGVTGAFQLTTTLVAIYTVARHRPHRYVWPAAAAFELVAVLAWLEQDRDPAVLTTGTASIAAAVMLGIAARSRRAYQDERARRLEQEHQQQLRLAFAAERARIAREMHDIVAHNLAVMVALADGAQYAAATSPERAADAMRQVSATGRGALSETRRLVGLLRDGEHPAEGEHPAGGERTAGGEQPAGPGGRAPQPGLADLDRLVDQVRAAGVRVEVTRQGVPGEWGAGAGAGLAVYRIVQEALTNALKHAGPHASVRIRLSFAPTGVDLEVIDDGAGRPARAVADRPDGHGLAGMIERAARYGGQVEAGPASGTGWRVRAWLQRDERSVP